MVHQVSLLVMLVQLVDRLPMPAPPAKRGRGRPAVYSDRLFLKALVIMILKHLHSPYELLCVVQQPTAEMEALRPLLTEQGRFPPRRTCNAASPPCRTSCPPRSAVWGHTSAT